ncbi:variable surface protein [Plasmodium gonderi]|uniref:Variable surface protein n=1 Tax=Plasmodium gonderi TaxID=77519 RepID=A0A1Y1JX70_PLAGO|nr:variable surface protein [Plasmodium gonderi]GAW84404.1 variable surface protein [Plasmodium gonderi]
MNTQTVLTENYDFKDIFPTCLNDFRTHRTNITNNVEFKIGNTCSVTAHSLKFNPDYREFFVSNCKNLLLYLYYIKNNKTTTDEEPSCKYFNYRLKYLLNTYKCPEKSTEKAYKTMIIKDNENTYFNISNICQLYIKDLSDDTFQKFENLNELYSIFKQAEGTCTKNTRCFNKYMNYSVDCDNSNNSSYCQILNKFKFLYILDTVIEPINKNISESTHSSTLIHIRAAFLTITFMTFLISTSIFILYKYTSYRSYSPPVLVKIKRLFNKKDEEYSTLLDSFKCAYNTSIDNDYRIEYSSVNNR